jgi:hypothetical protein
VKGLEMDPQTSAPLAVAKFIPTSEDVRNFQIWYLTHTQTGKATIRIFILDLLVMPVGVGGIIFPFDWKFAVGIVCIWYAGLLIKGRGSPRLFAVATVQNNFSTNNYEV